MLIERRFDAGPATLSYADSQSDGPPLVLLHGLSYRWQSWLTVMPTLALRWHVYAPDLRGFGASSRVPGGYRAVDYARDIQVFLREVVGQPAALVGHSLGAIVAVAVAADAPNLVRALVLEEPPLGIFVDQSMREIPAFDLYRRMRDLAAERPSLDEAATRLGSIMPAMDAVELRSLATSLLQRDPEALSFVLEDRAKEGLDLDRRLAGVECPVLLVQGNVAKGGALDDGRAQWALSRLRRGTHVYLPSAGHFIHHTHPVDFSRLLVDYLETL